MDLIQTQPDSAVSPVVAVILMVAVTVILSAVIGTFVLDLGQSATSSSTDDMIGVTSERSGSDVSVTIVTGSADRVELLVNGTVVDTLTNVSAGDVLSASVDENATVIIRSTTEGEGRVVSTVPPESSSVVSTVAAPTTGLFGRWTLDSEDTNSTHFLDVESGHDVAIQGDPSTGVAGMNGESAYFDGSGDYATAGDAAQLSGGQSLSVFAWVKIANMSASNFIAVKYKNGSHKDWGLHMNGEKVQYYAENGGDNDNLHRSATNLSEGTWYLVGFTWNESSKTSRLYINGSLDSTKSHSFTSPNTDVGIAIGAISPQAFYSPNHYFEGNIDDVRVYDRQLNKSEAGRLYNATK